MPKRLSTDQQRTVRSKLPASLFTTEALPTGERFAAWRESIGVILEARTAVAGAAPTFNARVENYLLDDIMLARSTFSAQKFDRRAIRIAQDSIDHYMIQFFLSGHLEMNLGRRSFRADRPLVAFDLSEVMDSFDSDCNFLCIMVPRRRLAPLLNMPDALQGLRVDPGSGAGRLLANYLVTLFSVASTLTQTEGSFAARTLLDLTALAFNGAALEAKRAAARGKSHVNVEYIGGVVPGNAADLKPLRAAGVRAFKCFLAPSGVDEFGAVAERDLRSALPELAGLDAPLMVHAEDPN